MQPRSIAQVLKKSEGSPSGLLVLFREAKVKCSGGAGDQKSSRKKILAEDGLKEKVGCKE